MKIYLKTVLLRFIKISSFIGGLCVPLCMRATVINLNFDVLFPMTWYQKGLESAINVWHLLAEVLKADTKAAHEQLPLDTIVCRLAFGQFCIEQMRSKNQQLRAEDSTYFVMVIDKIQSLLAMIIVMPAEYDRFQCVVDTLEKMKKTFNAATYTS